VAALRILTKLAPPRDPIRKLLLKMSRGETHSVLSGGDSSCGFLAVLWRLNVSRARGNPGTIFRASGRCAAAWVFKTGIRGRPHNRTGATRLVNPPRPGAHEATNSGAIRFAQLNRRNARGRALRKDSEYASGPGKAKALRSSPRHGASRPRS